MKLSACCVVLVQIVITIHLTAHWENRCCTSWGKTFTGIKRNFTACFRCWIPGPLDKLRPQFCLIALATTHNATQIPLTVWIRIFSQCECVHEHSYQNGTSTLLLRNGLVRSHIASEGKPYCISPLARGLRSLPLVTLHGAWTHCGWFITTSSQARNSHCRYHHHFT